jgi:hypothetical protein
MLESMAAVEVANRPKVALAGCHSFCGWRLKVGQRGDPSQHRKTLAQATHRASPGSLQDLSTSTHAENDSRTESALAWSAGARSNYDLPVARRVGPPRRGHLNVACTRRCRDNTWKIIGTLAAYYEALSNRDYRHLPLVMAVPTVQTQHGKL